jgi:hypothetical protein
VLQHELVQLIRQPAAPRLYQRHERYRRLGTSGPDIG